MKKRPERSSESGFTLVEVTVAMALLLTAVLGLMSLTDSAARTTSDTRAREGAVNVAREMVEGAAGVPYSGIKSATIQSTLQGVPGLASQSTPGWTVVRRNATGSGGFTYTLAATECSIDDPSDGGSTDHSSDVFCPGSSTTGDDPQPEDFKRVTATVTWSTSGRSHSVTQTAVLAKNGAADLPTIKSLVLTNPTVTNPSNPVIGSSATSVSFTATASTTADRVVYSVDGVDMGDATLTGGNWNFGFSIAGWSDGSYTIGVRALNVKGVPGPTRTLTLTLSRTQPGAPPGLQGGRNVVTKNGSPTQVVELEWLANSERNVLGYRVYRPGGSLACPADMQTLDLGTNCIDFSPVDGIYKVVAVYRDSAGVLREGASSSLTVQPLQPPFNSYYFKDTTGFTGNNCASADGQRDADDSYAGVATDTGFSFAGGVASLSFCTRALAPADATVAGTATVYAWATNSGNSACAVTGTLYLNGSAAAGSASATVAARTNSAAPLTWSFNVTAYTFQTGDRVNVLFVAPNGGACNSTSLFYGSTSRRSRLDLPRTGGGTPVGTPLPPTNLRGTSNADGSKTLTWTAPSGGTAVDSYRIYRDGVSYTDRYDRTGDATPSYTDPNTDGGTHTYYVTAVSANLAESSIVGPVAP